MYPNNSGLVYKQWANCLVPSGNIEGWHSTKWHSQGFSSYHSTRQVFFIVSLYHQLSLDSLKSNTLQNSFTVVSFWGCLVHIRKVTLTIMSQSDLNHNKTRQSVNHGHMPIGHTSILSYYTHSMHYTHNCKQILH